MTTNPRHRRIRCAHDEIANAVLAAIQANPSFMMNEQQQTNYDAPMTPTNPTGTNHGATQGATLNTNP